MPGVFEVYILAFGLSAVACLFCLLRVPQVEDAHVRIGLAGLLATSGGWAAAHVGYLAIPSVTGKLLFYLAGLVLGFAAIGAWLYFCSAYTDRTYHRDRTYRHVAVTAFFLVIILKLTNPIHSLYFTSEMVSTPFYHLAINHGVLHWMAMGLAYALAFVGFFMLFERFVAVGLRATPIAVLVVITAFPVSFDVIGAMSPQLIDMTYEPIGVAIFSVGVLFLYFEEFQAITVAGEREGPVIYLDKDGNVRDYNPEAFQLFPPLADAVGSPLESVSPQLATAIENDESVIERGGGSTTKYYMVSTSPFTSGAETTGRLVTLSDVTESEQYRRELERKTETLEKFASVVSHDLRNPLNVATLRLELAKEESDSEHLADVERALERMEALIEDLLTLAREGRSIDDLQRASLSSAVEDCWAGVETGDATLVVETDAEMVADPSRLQQLLENLVRNAIQHGGDDVTVTVGDLPDGFFVEDDGPGIPEDEREEVFEFGYSTDSDGTGFGLSIVAEIVSGHGWDITATEGTDGGARFEITGVENEL